VKIAQLAKTGLFPDNIETLGALGDKLSTAFYWHRDFPYKSTLTGISGHDLADGYERASGKQWESQLGASMALLDAGVTAIKASGNPKSKAAIAKALSTLKTTVMTGKIDFTSGPVPNVSTTNLVGVQWIKGKEGSKFSFDPVVTNNATDPHVPVAAKLLPYNS
jgi:branched-chain amino acid transport system substrate-binding protein